MTRMVFRLWLMAVFVFALSLLSFEVVGLLTISEDDRVYLNTLLGPYRFVLESIQSSSPESREQVISEMEQVCGVALTVIAEEDVDRFVVDQFEDGVLVAWQLELFEDYGYLRMADGRHLLRFGPVPSPPIRDAPVTVGLLLLFTAVFALGFWLVLLPWNREQRSIEEAAESIAQGHFETRLRTARGATSPTLVEAFNKMAQRTDATVSSQRELLRAVSHELRTPISRVRIGVHLMAGIDEKAERMERSEALDDDLQQLDDLVDELLTHARLESKKGKVKKTGIVVATLVADVVDEVSAARGSIELEIAHAIDKDLHVAADERLIHRALRNLVENAARYADAKVRLHARATAHGVEILVDDDGAGVPEKERERVLLPFVRLEDDHETGYGMGLAIAAQILAWHSGKIVIDTSDLGGCRVTTFWPAEQAE